MADLDTENKRRSALPIPFTIPPVADGIIETQDRPPPAYMYGGIVYGAPATAGIKIILLSDGRLAMKVTDIFYLLL